MHFFKKYWIVLFYFVFNIVARYGNAVQFDNVVYDKNHWVMDNVFEIKKRLSNLGLSLEENLPKAKNVIFFIGDGMGLNTLTAARILKGQRNQQSGEYEKLIWDEFPSLAHVKTFTSNTMIGESAACATAMFTGVKTNSEVIGFDARTKFNNCSSHKQSSKLMTLFDWAQEAGLKTGFVTTTRVSHATPAALYAHVSNRYWEDDSKVPVQYRKHCKDITRQLVEGTPGRNINVIMGGGRRSWLPLMPPEYGTKENQTNPKKGGRRLDARNLVYDWLKDKQHKGLKAKYVTNRSEMFGIGNEVDYLLGLFSYTHLAFHADRSRDMETREQPSLLEMTRAALKVLNYNSTGFVLVVESGRIDHAHHHNNAYRALDETLALEETVRDVIDSNLIDLRETLIIVTADHAEGMLYSGYNTPIGSNILGVDPSKSDADGQYYPLLTYAAGTGNYAYERNKHPKDTIQPSTIPKSWGNHGGEDVPLFAAGPLSSTLFTGTIDQTYIPQAIAYAMCISIHLERCNRQNNNENIEIYESEVKSNQWIDNFSSLLSVNINDTDFYIENRTNSDSKSTSLSYRNSYSLFVVLYLILNLSLF
uniref:alkaline phosphatase n=1 Tax=Culicoides sonorensis TaxID=179676 RepID=A0A336LPP2_CULSO